MKCLKRKEFWNSDKNRYNCNDCKCNYMTLFNSIYGEKPFTHNDYNKRIQAIYLGNLNAWY